MHFLPQKTIKGVTDFLAEHPDPRAAKLYEDLPDEVAEVCLTQTSFEGQVWQLFFDGASRMSPKGHTVAGVGVVLVSPQNYVIPRAISLTEPCSNNVAEYNALLIGMQFADEIALKISRHTATPSSSSAKFAGSTKSDMKTWYPTTTQLSAWPRGLQTSTSTMYRAGKMRTQMHSHPWLPP